MGYKTSHYFPVPPSGFASRHFWGRHWINCFWLIISTVILPVEVIFEIHLSLTTKFFNQAVLTLSPLGKVAIFVSAKQPVSSEVSLKPTVMLIPSALSAVLDRLIEYKLQMKACDRATVSISISSPFVIWKDNLSAFWQPKIILIGLKKRKQAKELIHCGFRADYARLQ